MATTENNGLFTYLDASGNKQILYPITKLENVDGLEEALADKAPVNHVTNKSNPHGVTASQVGAVPTSRTINGKKLSSNVTLSAADVGAMSVTLLWTNASPMSTFENQNITVNTLDYSFLVIEFITTTGIPRRDSTFFPNGDLLMLSSSLPDGRIVSRDVTNGYSYLGFGPGKLSGADNNDSCVPTKVYGLKG